MALQKQQIQMPFTQGVETKIDPKLVQPPYLSNLENGVFTKIGSVIKRFGYDRLGQDIIGGGTISSCDALCVFNDELLLVENATLYAYVPSSNKWISRGQVNPLVVGKKEVIRNSYAQTLPMVAYAGGVMLFAWADSRGGVRASVLDSGNFTVLQNDVSISASGDRPRCIAINGVLFVLWRESATLKCKRVDPLVPTTFSSTTSIVTDMDSTNPNYDICQLGVNAVFAYNGPSTNTKVAYLRSDAVVGSPTYGLPAAVAVSGAATNSICIKANTVGLNDYIYVAYCNSSIGCKCYCLLQDFVEQFAATTIDAYTTKPISNITAEFASTTSLKFFYEIHETVHTEIYIKTNTISQAGTAGTEAVLKRSVALASKAFVVDGVIYFVSVHPSTLQAAYFLLDSAGNIKGKMIPGNAGEYAALPVLTDVVAYLPGVYVCPMLVKGNLESETSVIFTPTGVVGSTLDFATPSVYLNTQLGDNLHITGSFLSCYDGLSTFESGFHLYPETVTGSAATSGGSMADGTYYYTVVYEWWDAKGQLHRSAPSTQLSVVVTGGSGSGKVTLTIPSLRLTARQSPRGEVSLAVYRTVVSGTIFYRVSSITSPTFNNPAVDSVSFADTLNDTSITGNELLYTTGGTIENIAPSSCSLIAGSKTRLFLAGLDDPYLVQYSKEHVQGEPVNFSDLFTMRVDPQGGPIRGLAIMDEKICMLTSRGLLYVVGDGPLDTGEQNTFTLPQYIPSNVGLEDSNSVVTCDKGILFKSEKGIHLLDRSLNTSYVGSPVEQWNGYTVSSARVIENANEVRFTLNNGPTLVWNYFSNTWATFTNQLAVDSESWNTSWVFVKADGAVYKQGTTYLDDGLPISLSLETAWIKISAVQSLQRIYRALFLGSFKSSHVFKVDIAYDYSDVYTESITWDAGASLKTSYYGEDAYYGEKTPYGDEEDNVYQIRIHMPRQKCQAVKFRIYDISQAGTGESFEITHLQLEVGVKGQAAKLKALKSA